MLRPTDIENLKGNESRYAVVVGVAKRARQIAEEAENEGVVLTRSVLMDRIWGCEFERENRTLDVHIRTLRAKLGEAGSCIETVRGVGYKIEGNA